ncbi:L,D-transpeptidase [Jannaschia seohaensis]|uniref:Lipoprotein-anchoring transpeptidase ErfK/SrfK n=1 Tax=Jannaschia seohaensis TaxID=475081 RepID=A0A2Y9C823_9RHOB|nr:L,D-transpeptidase [Jannaschia seohaensis]PWJ17493.1 lipoprotein-anchoring transpeptidase ErfK/SrfK [Jannaschia seohaensis]SSA47593.1 Lipoprotein-anchoring transpeptidase ErfK/SrfK [Jannaschia seohaensis]
MLHSPSNGRRAFLIGLGATALTTPALAQSLPDTVIERDPLSHKVLRNIASFRGRRWRDHFRSLDKGAILVDIESRTLHMWQQDGTHYLYPSSIPVSEELTRRGRTRVVRKVVGPTWRPTANMLRRNPDWPRVVPPGPGNPLGTHALYLSWAHYRIHGTHDPRKIGRRSSSGCIGLYNEDIAEVFSMATIGTQVLLI